MEDNGARDQPLAMDSEQRSGVRRQGQEKRAFAKVVALNSHHPVFYMTERQVFFGRRPNRPGESHRCVCVSKNVQVSRKHVRIELSLETHSFELTVLGKNGAYVNGKFVDRGNPPVRLISQSEVTFGATNPVTLIFLLPCAHNSTVAQKQGAGGRLPKLLATVCQVVLESSGGKLSAVEIVAALTKSRPRYVKSLGPPSLVSASVRHVLTVNPDAFVVHPAGDLNANVHAPDLDMYRIKDAKGKRTTPALYEEEVPSVSAAKFGIASEYRSRFKEADAAKKEVKLLRRLD